MVVCAVSGYGCGGGGGGGGSGGSEPTISFAASPTTAAANRVRLANVSTSSDSIRIAAVIDGPTTSNDLYAFAFDIVLSGSNVASYQLGSATAGVALTQGGANPLVQVAQDGNRVVVGISRTGAGPGVGLPAGQSSIVLLTFNVQGTGATTLKLEGSPDNPQNPAAGPAALDSSLQPIPSITFDAALASISRQ